MKWLLGYVIASMAGGFVINRLFDFLFAGVLGTAAAGVAKLGLFASTWTAITTGLGMRDYNKGVKQLRKHSSSARKR